MMWPRLSGIHLYADDTIIYSSGPSLHSAASTLQLSLVLRSPFTTFICVLLEEVKTKFMLFNRKNSVTCPTKITCADGSELEFVSSYKYLGLWLDNSLSFKFHVNNLQAKVKARLGFLYRNKASFTHSAKHTLVKMTILTMFDYGDVIYKMASKCALNWLDALHHSAICFATGVPQYLDTSPTSCTFPIITTT